MMKLCPQLLEKLNGLMMMLHKAGGLPPASTISPFHCLRCIGLVGESFSLYFCSEPNESFARLEN